jgi:hypothetical protein
MEATITKPMNLSDGELTAEVQRLAATERQSTASLIAHLAEFDARRLHLGAGFRSLFCTVRRRCASRSTRRTTASRPRAWSGGSPGSSRCSRREP